MNTFIRQMMTVAAKDLVIEGRSRERILSMFTFAVLVAVVFSFSLDSTVPGVRIGGAMLWVTLLFAGLLGLGRSFSLEKEQDAFVGVLLTPISRSALYLGKFLANLTLLVATAVVIFVVYGLFFQLPYGAAVGGLALVAILGSVGFMALGTLFSAMAVNTRLGDTLLPIVLFPLLIPVVFFAASATQRLLLLRPFDEIAGSIRVLAAFDILFLVVCSLAFEYVVEE